MHTVSPENGKIGRNDRCACGSGRKYKHCCLSKTELSPENLRARQSAAHNNLLPALMAYADRKFAEYLDFAFSDFQLGQLDSLNPDDESQIFVPYFLFLWNPALSRNRKRDALPGGVVAKAFLLELGRTLKPLEREMLERSMAEPMSFFEVMASEPGRRMVLRDILTRKESEVWERSASQNARAGDIFFAQLIQAQGIVTLNCTAPFVIPPRMKADVVALRNRLRLRAGRITVELESRHLARFEKEVRSVYFDIRRYLHAPPVLCNTDGDLLGFHTLTFEISSAETAFQALAPLSKGVTKKYLLEEAEYDSSGALHKIAFEWRKLGNAKMAEWDNTILGKLRIEGRALVAEVNSHERAEKLLRQIEKRLGASAVHQGTVSQSVEEAMREMKKEPPAERRRRLEEHKAEKTPEMRQVEKEMNRRHLHAWANQKLPILGGRTPLQAVKDPDGREIVESLLKEFERQAENDDSDEIRPDVSVLRKRLKLDA